MTKQELQAILQSKADAYEPNRYTYQLAAKLVEVSSESRFRFAKRQLHRDLGIFQRRKAVKCDHCGRTIIRRPEEMGRWIHKYTKRVNCTRSNAEATPTVVPQAT